jgi:hypothetical protein
MMMCSKHGQSEREFVQAILLDRLLELREAPMQSAASATLNEAYDESDVAAHDIGGTHDAFDDRVRVVPEDTRYDERLRWSRPDAPQRGSNLENGRREGEKPSFAKRLVRATVRFVVAVLIGVGATLAWQAYGDQARAMLATLDPSLAWLAPVPAAQPAAAAATSSDVAQQLKPIALELAALHQQLQQLAAKQDQLAANQAQLAQGLSAVQATEHDVGLKISSMAQPKPKPVHPQPHPAAPRPLQPPAEPDGQ